MKSIMRKISVISITSILALGMFGSKGNVDDPDLSVAKPTFSVASGAVTIKAIAIKSGMDNSAVASASYTVAAVIVCAATAEKPALGVGIVPSTSYLPWCTTDAEGKDKTIEGLVGNINSGYSDGSNGWEILKDACSDAEEHPEYYPSWKYCLEYGITQNFEGDLATGWYFPTAIELETISNDLTTINSSLTKAGKTGLSGWYTSCSLDSTTTFNVAKWLGSTGSGTRTRTSAEGKVCAVRAFK